MSSPVLFSTGAAPTATASRNLVEFKAGKMELNGKMVHPIKRKGLVYLRQSQEDHLMHFCWEDRQSGEVVDDLILFPDDCEFKRVKECTTGRVYVLKMKSNNKKMFFWMQEPRTDRDDELCKKVNDLLNNPPRGGNDNMGSSSNGDLQALFGNMNQEQMAQLLSSHGVDFASLLSRLPSGNSGGGGSTSSTASTTNSSAPTSATSASGAGANASASSGATGNDSTQNMDVLGELRAIMTGAVGSDMDDDTRRSLMAAAAGSRGSLGELGAESRQGDNSGQMSQVVIDLSTAVNSDSLAHLLQDEEFLRKIEPHLPPISTLQQQQLSSEELRTQFADTVRSSQFRSSLSQFCVALQSGQLGPLMSQFGLNQSCVDAANLGNLEAFVRALEAQTKSKSDASPRSASQQPGDRSDGNPPPAREQD